MPFKRGPGMTFSYSAIWDDTVRMLRAYSPLLLPVAGMFLFLPSLIFGYAAPVPEPVADQSQAMDAMLAYYSDNLWWMLLVFAIGFVGHLTILIMVLNQTSTTVGQAIGRALRRFPVYLGVSILVGLILFVTLIPASIWFSIALLREDAAMGTVGAILLALPAAYLSARFAATAPAVAAEPQLGMVGALRRSFYLTRGSGWAILGILLAIMLAMMVMQLAATFVFGSIFRLVDIMGGGEQQIGALLDLIVRSAISALFNTVIFVLLASIYRRLLSRDASSSGT